MLAIRGGRIAAGISVALLAALTVPAVGFAEPDYDHDGYAGPVDCQPFDPAVHPGAPDLPDLSLEDTNCDGIDGTAANSIFVAPGGSDSATGTSANPFRTIQKAINVAAAGQDVLIAGGVYDARPTAGEYGDVQLKSGVSLYGGYVPGTWTRSPSTEPTTLIGAPEAVLGNGTTGVVLQLMTLEGKHGPGSTAYGIRLIGGADVALQKVTVSAETGGPGNAGQTPPGSAASGGNGWAGGTGLCDSAGGTGGPGGYGVGGGGRGGDGGSGHEGGNGDSGSNGGTVVLGGWSGLGGRGGAGGLVGDPGSDARAAYTSGGATAGAAGLTGSGGAGGVNSLSSAGSSWTGPSGGTGGAGGPGAGGGGGGAGGGQTGFLVNDGGGSGGGGGGGGGAGGAGGTGGGVGGGSFGIYLHGNSSVLLLAGTTVQTGNGGPGGTGAGGQWGGQGGWGGAGGNRNCSGEVGLGAYGASGGVGGRGGSGGGGAGGPAFKVLRVNSLLMTSADSALGTQTSTGGGGGAGGAGATTGQQGQSGADMALGVASGPTDFDGDGLTDSADACPTVSGPAINQGCPVRPAKMVPLPVNLSPPTISGELTEGQMLTEGHGTWSNNPTAYAHQWQRCDGAGNNCAAIGGATGHTYTLTGADVGHTIRIQETARNSTGAATTSAQSQQTALIRLRTPKLTGLMLSPRTFRAARTGNSVSTSPKIGTKVRFKLTIAARVRVTTKRQTAGRRAGNACGAITRKNRSKRRCHYWKTVTGSFTVTGKPGNNTFRFSGRIGGRTLRAGVYRLIATPTSNGKAGSAQTASFTIKR